MPTLGIRRARPSCCASAVNGTAAAAPYFANAVKAAYFQGHVEFLGLTPAGALRAPAAPGSANLIALPAGIATLPALAMATGVAQPTILAANPGLNAAGPLPAQGSDRAPNHEPKIDSRSPPRMGSRRRTSILPTPASIGLASTPGTAF